jgi:hypothetical protein
MSIQKNGATPHFGLTEGKIVADLPHLTIIFSALRSTQRNILPNRANSMLQRGETRATNCLYK